MSIDKEKLLKIAKKGQMLEKTGHLGLAKSFIEIDDKINEVKENVQTISEELKKKLELELVYEVDEQKIAENVLSKVEIPSPIKGEQGLRGEKGDSIIGKPGKDGKNGKDGIAGKEGLPGIDGSPDTRLQIVEKINTGKKNSLKIELQQIEGIKKSNDALVQFLKDWSIGILDQRTSFLINKVSNLSNTVNTLSPSIGGTITGGTAGSVLFVNPDNVIAQDNANLFWDDANNRLGIGINSSLLAAIHVSGSGAGATTGIANPGTGSTSWIAFGAVTARGLIYSGGGAIDFGTGSAIGSPTINGTNQMRFDVNNQRIGIGTTSPNSTISPNGNFPTTFIPERHTTSNTAGNILTLRAGGATSAATNKNGGDLMLQGGISTGSGTSNVLLQAYPGIAASTTDNTPVTVATGSAVGATAVPTLIMAGSMRLKGYTVATLPAGTQGDTAFVTDALAPTFLATIVGGGTVVTPVFYNGTNWVGY